MSVHIPALPSTEGIINASLFQEAKNLSLLNFARHEVVNTSDVLSCLGEGNLTNFITDLTGKIYDSKTLKDLISNKGIHEAKNYAKNNPGDLNVSDVEYLPLIPNPGKIICVGLNYSEHVKETNRTVEELSLIHI